MKKLLIAAAVLVSMTACIKPSTPTAPPVSVASAVYSDWNVTVTMGNGLSHVFTRGEICGKTYGEVGGHRFVITGSGGGSNVTIGGVRVVGLTCPTVSNGVGDSGSSNWVADTNPVGTYSPEVSGSGGADSTNVGYNPTGGAPGDQGVNNQGGVAPPPNGTPDPAAPAPAPAPAPATPAGPPPANGGGNGDSGTSTGSFGAVSS